MLKRYNIEGIVLKSFNHKDSDKIYTIYTRLHGKVSVFAKGVRKISSRRGGNLDTLNHVVVSINEHSPGYRYAGEVLCKDVFFNVKKDLEGVYHGFYICELIHKLTPEGTEYDQDSQKIFDLLLKTLKLLDSTRVSKAHVVVFFEILFVKLLGYEITFSNLATFKDDVLFLEGLSNGKIRTNLNVSKDLDTKIKMYIQDILEEKTKSLSMF